jgi:hypothetical protein
MVASSQGPEQGTRGIAIVTINYLSRSIEDAKTLRKITESYRDFKLID